MSTFWKIVIGLLALAGAIMVYILITLSHSDVARPVGDLACGYRAIPMTVDTGGPGPAPAPSGSPSGERPMLMADAPGPFAAEVAQVESARENRNDTPVRPAPSFAVLSGGGEHGAFGAGFFSTLPQVPTYDIVTGISTGSLQSTLLFLANQPVPKDRNYDWVDGPMASEIKPGTSSLGDLALAYSISDEGDLMTRTSWWFVGGLAKGSLATFAPLKKRLEAIISPDTLRAVAAEAAKGRRLYVGVVSLDDGSAYAIDMTELASRVDTPEWKDKTAALQSCYADALLASSTVPPGVPPIGLAIATKDGVRNDMFVDGGVRFGVFLEQILRALGEEAPKDAKVTLIVNGSYYAGPWSSDGKPRETWNVLDVAQRTINLLETQVYNFSEASAERFGTEHGGLDLAFIGNRGLPAGSIDPANFVFRGKTCTDWTAIDNQSKPLEFHANYMSCMIAYGQSRGKAASWNLQRGAPAP